MHVPNWKNLCYSFFTVFVVYIGYPPAGGRWIWVFTTTSGDMGLASRVATSQLKSHEGCQSHIPTSGGKKNHIHPGRRPLDIL